MARLKTHIEVKNRRATFAYELIESFVAGIVLVGTEVKSIRAGGASLTDAYGVFTGDELFVRNMHIAEYRWGNIQNHAPRRDRKLLMTRRELRRLQRRTVEKGLAIIATRLYIAENGYAKLEIALARGRKAYDKREHIKEKDHRRDIQSID
jgi:SsrA-binding protein